MSGKLLEVLSQQTGLFISELKNPYYRNVVLQQCIKLGFANITVDELNYALSYLFDTELTFGSVQEAQAYIQRNL